MAGIINPRRLIKAQHEISSSKYGCELMHGQVDKIKRVDVNEKGSNNTNTLFLVDVAKYPTNHSTSSAISTKECVEIYAKRIILANGVYTNILPKFQVRLQDTQTLFSKKTHINVIYIFPL